MSVEHYTTGGAVGAVASPWWLPSLHTISDTAAEVLPILGVLWLLFQIGVKVYDLAENKKDD